MELQILYVDTLFFVNFALDLLALILASLFLHLGRRLVRLLIASALGALYAVAAVLLSLHPALHTVLSILLSLLLVAVAFRDFVNSGRFFAAVLLFYLSSILLGGAIDALYAVLESLVFLRNEATIKPSDLVLLLGFAAFGLIYAASRFFGNAPVKKVATVRITLSGKSVTLPLLVDSGCLLCDPISGKPALLVRLEALSGVLPSEIIACARSSTAYMPRDPQNARRCRLIPATALDGKRLLLSIRADEVYLIPEKKEKGGKGGYSLDAFVALYSVGQSHFGGFEGLFPSSLFA